MLLDQNSIMGRTLLTVIRVPVISSGIEPPRSSTESVPPH
jgi:hypothetical protein